MKGTFTAVASFGPIAPYYDELMSSIPYDMWVSYYLLLLAHQQAHPITILDVCCGTGKMCERLIEEGRVMTGLDISEPMIQVARQQAMQYEFDIDYHVADAADFDLGKTFDAAFSFFDSLNNIIERDRFQSALRCVSNHLSSGGSFIFDVNMPYAFEAQLFDQEDMRASSSLKYKWKGDYDPDTQIIKVDMRFWKDGEAFREIHKQRAYALEDVMEMLGEAGFTHLKAYHSYTLNPPRRTSDRLHFMALKR